MKFLRLAIAALLLTSISIMSVVAAPEADSPATVTRALYRSSMDLAGERQAGQTLGHARALRAHVEKS